MAQAQPLQSISIPRHEARSSFVVFAILVQLPVRSWTIYRRFSEFVALDKALPRAPRPLPPKEGMRKTFSGFLGRSGEGAEEDAQFLRERRQGLEEYLKAIVMDESPEWRETDDFKRFIEWPQGIRMTTAPTPPPQRSAPTPRIHPPSVMPGAMPSRTLGRPKAEETDLTRPLNDDALLQSQNDQMDDQDQQLNNLAVILRRQRHMGEAINNELLEQNELLSQLDTEVEATKGKMDTAGRKMDRFDGGMARRKVGAGR